MALTLSGFGVGALIGLTGVGGGSLMTPLLIFLFGIAPVIAVGTDLLFAAITKVGGVWHHNRQRTIAWRIAVLLAAGSLPTAMVTISLLERFQAEGMRIDALVTGVLGVALVFTSLALLGKTTLQRLGEQIKAYVPGWRQWRGPATVLAGIILGILVPVSSIGAGALGAGMLLFLYPSLPTVKIVGTDLAHAAPLAAVAGLGHLRLGSVDPALLAALLIGSLPGIYLGSRMGAVIPERTMRTILASTLMLIGIKTIF